MSAVFLWSVSELTAVAEQKKAAVPSGEIYITLKGSCNPFTAEMWTEVNGWF